MKLSGGNSSVSVVQLRHPLEIPRVTARSVAKAGGDPHSLSTLDYNRGKVIGRALRSRSASPHLWGLLLMVVVSPWLLGGARTLFRRALTLTALLLCLAWLAWRRKAPVLAVPLHLWPLGALMGLFALQLVPLPRSC